MNLRTAVNAKAQRRKDAEKKDFSWAAKFRFFHRGGEQHIEKIEPVLFASPRLGDFAFIPTAGLKLNVNPAAGWPKEGEPTLT